MAWDNTWEKIYQEKDWGKYPPEELVRFMMRNYKGKQAKVLDLGCGTGAATWFLSREGFNAYGIDGSETAIQKAKQRFQQENLKGEFVVGDFIKLNYPDNFFDCIIDISSLQHNSLEDLKLILEEVHRVLKPEGKIFSMMANQNSIINQDVNIHSERYIHRVNKEEVNTLFSKFNNLIIDESSRTDNSNRVNHFLIQAQK